MQHQKNPLDLDGFTALLDKLLPFLKNVLAPKWRQLIAWSIVALVVTAVNVYLNTQYVVPPPPTFVSPADDQVVALGVTHFTALQASGSETDELVVNQTSTGDIAEFRDNGTVVFRIADGGDVTHAGTTPFLTIGDGGEEDAGIIVDGAAQDFYLALDDTADDFLIGLGSTVGTTGIIYLDESQDTGLGGASAGAKLDVTGNVMIDGAADEVQLTVSGYTTQTNSPFVVEETGGTDLFWVTNNGDVEMNGTTPLLTIGDAGEEDTAIVFDGAAQDFHIGLDDTADDLVVGKGSALGTTTAFSIDENQVTTWVGGTICLAEIHTAADTLTASECGKTVFLNSATEFQIILPAVSTVSAGCEFRFIVKAAPSGASYTVITGNTTEDVLIGGINELEVDTGDDGPYDASADTLTFVDGVSVVGDYVYMISDGSYFYVTGQANADGGVTITDSD